jgi:hypothetical protein
MLVRFAILIGFLGLAAAGGHRNSPIVVAGRIELPEGEANDPALSGVIDINRLG